MPQPQLWVERSDTHGKQLPKVPIPKWIAQTYPCRQGGKVFILAQNYLGTSHNHQTLSALKQVKIFTDGACSGNPGPGGYGTIVVVDGVESELSQGYKRTTNNRMEIRAVLAGLESLTERCDVQVFSDSKYVVDSIKLNWAKGWKAKGWRRGTGEKALNPDLWAKMLDECARHKVTMNWVKGHAGHPENERCDELAVAACSSRELLVDEGFEG